MCDTILKILKTNNQAEHLNYFEESNKVGVTSKWLVSYNFHLNYVCVTDLIEKKVLYVDSTYEIHKHLELIDVQGIDRYLTWFYDIGLSENMNELRDYDIKEIRAYEELNNIKLLDENKLYTIEEWNNNE